MPVLRWFSSAANKWIWTSSSAILLLISISCLATLVLVVLSAPWAAKESDAAALDRQRLLVNARLHDQVAQVAQDVRMMAFGYGSLERMQPQTNEAAIDEQQNKSFAASTADLFTQIVAKVLGYDKTFLVGADQNLAMDFDAADSKRFKWIKPLLRPMLQQLQSIDTGISERVLPGEQPASLDTVDRTAVEMMRLEGRPSIVGIAPIRHAYSSDISAQNQPVYLIAIRFLDGAVLDTLSRDQGLNGTRFSRAADVDETEVAFEIDATATKEPIGFIIWRPDLPGSRVVQRLIPALSAAALITAILFYTLIQRLRRSLSKLELSEQAARHLALHDVLTSLPNRAMFAARLEDATERLVAKGKASAVALIDLDRFKAVNDTFGHAAGDELIRQAAARMKDIIGEKDTLARIGGDEFALLLTHVEEAEESYGPLLKRIVSEISNPFVLMDGEVTVHIGCSIGIAMLDKSAQTTSDVLRSADVALYQSKMGGRGRWLAYAPTMDQMKTEREARKDELRNLLSIGESEHLDKERHHLPDPGCLEMHFQSIHQARAGSKISGAEALARWRHHRYGLLSADHFIPLAEEAGLIHELGRQVLRRSCQAAKLWPKDTYVAVNVSPTQLKSPSFEGEVNAILEETGLEPWRLELEVTESSLFTIDEPTQAVLIRLRATGIKIALDDFGTGFSSLSHLLHVGIDRVKIDRSFVKLLGSHSNGTAIIAAIVGLAHTLHLSVTAEGVETEEQRDFLEALGCSDLQGFFFSQPISSGELFPLMWPATEHDIQAV
ncbi:putative bifunctional diguanylate cyclase/phosphodiesterase [Oryzifoliimicrobium ureilyticus]|uniref:putative bifunctional diguanylate cyclase/phosphodiesterase n=1 Tax=Oryzifoliimicrobium ureilyticus TaxID=3113724 RepID=UPI0030765C3D